MPSIDFKTIKLQCPLREVLDLVAWRPVWSRGGQSRGPCPIHHSRDPRSRSFCVKDDGWYCHKCKIGGDQLYLWSLLSGKDILAATIDLCERLQRPVYYLERSLWSATRNRKMER